MFDSATCICTFPNKEEELYQEAEPVVSTGLSAALQMAMKKGFVDTEKKKKDPSKIVHIYGDEQRDRYVEYMYIHVRTYQYHMVLMFHQEYIISVLLVSHICIFVNKYYFAKIGTVNSMRLLHPNAQLHERSEAVL